MRCSPRECPGTCKRPWASTSPRSWTICDSRPRVADLTRRTKPVEADREQVPVRGGVQHTARLVEVLSVVSERRHADRARRRLSMTAGEPVPPGAEPLKELARPEVW